MIYVFPVGSPRTREEVAEPEKFKDEAIPYRFSELLGDGGLFRLMSEYSLDDLRQPRAQEVLGFSYPDRIDGRRRFYDAWSLLKVDITLIVVHLPSKVLGDFQRMVGQPSVLITSLYTSEFIEAVGNSQTVEISQVLTLEEARRYKQHAS